MQRDATNHVDEGAELTAAQSIALASLLAGDQITEAGRKAGVDRTTVHRWTASDPAFIAALRRGKADILDGARAALRNLATEAVDALAGVLRDPEAPPAARIKAAATVLEMVGANTPEAIGPGDPGDVQDELADADERRHLKRALRVNWGDGPDVADAATLVRRALGV